MTGVKMGESMIRPLLAAWAVVFGCSFAAAQQLAITRLDGEQIEPAQIDATVTQLMQAAHVTGVGIAIFHNRKIVYLHAYGMRDTEKACR
jgi:CubicO group peptidase (beta-lactamase class C family)